MKWLNSGNELISSKPAKTLKEVIHKLIPRKGIKQKGNIEGSELLDYDDGELALEELQIGCDEEEEMNEGFEIEGISEKAGAIAVPSVNKSHVSFSSLTDDPDIKQDCEFLDKLQNIITDSTPSKLFIPYLSQFRATYEKAWRSLKKRIEAKSSENEPRNPQEFERRGNTGNRDFQTVIPPNEEPSTWNGLADTEEPDVNQYWEISNGKDSLYATSLKRILLWYNFLS